MKALTGEKFEDFRNYIMGYPVKKDSLLSLFSPFRRSPDPSAFPPANPACIHRSFL